jgi:hypothetical protein
VVASASGRCDWRHKARRNNRAIETGHAERLQTAGFIAGCGEAERFDAKRNKLPGDRLFFNARSLHPE